MSTLVNIQLGYKNAAWFAANPTLVLLEGQVVNYLQTGTYKIGDGITQLSALSFLGSSGGSQNIQQVLTVGNIATTTIQTTGFIKTGGTSSQFLKADGSIDSSTYITASALTSYVPYTGATTNVNLGTNNLSLNAILNIGNSTYNPGATLNLSNSTGNTYGSFSAQSSTGQAYLQFECDGGIGYTNIGHIGSAVNVGVNTLFVSGGGFIQCATTRFTLTNGLSGGILVFGTDGYTAASERFRIAAAGVTVTGSLQVTGSANIGNAVITNQKQVRIGQGTSYVDVGEISGTFPGIWMQTATPSTTNYSFGGDGSYTVMNAAVACLFRQNGITWLSAVAEPTSLNGGGVAFQSLSSTASTASTGFSTFTKYGSTLNWATGAIATQSEVVFTAPTYSFVGASVITNAYGMYVSAPIAGTNATITNNWALGLSGNLNVIGNIVVSGTITGTIAGTVTSVSGTASRITSTGGTTPVIDISASYVGQSSITTVGTIATGTWQGTSVSTTYTDAKIKGSASVSGGVFYQSATDTATTHSAFTYSSSTGVILAIDLVSTSNIKTTAGKISIGTTTVAADLLISRTSSAGAGVGANIQNTTATGYSYIQLTNNTSSAALYAYHTGTSYATSGVYIANAAYIEESVGVLLAIGNYAATGEIMFYTGGAAASNEAMRIQANNNISISASSATSSFTATAYLHIAAGSATASKAPIKLTSGTNLTTAEAGAFEYNGTNLFFTRSGTTRENILVGNDSASAPSTTVGVAIVNYYGSSATNFLGTPNSWASVVISGTTYKIPLYT